MFLLLLLVKLKNKLIIIKMEENKTDKYEYLNAPCLLENFKNTYLTSLNVFLNDDKFNQKVENLPQLKSSTITKYEKLIFKEEQEKLKKNKKKKRSIES